MNNPTKSDPGLSTADFVAGARSHEEIERTEPDSAAGAQMVSEEKPAPLFNEQETQELRGRWIDIQAGFVDEPRKAVEQADSLVAGTMKRLAEVFANERSNLEHQWDSGDNISTEDLRVALQRYRSFFNRLLSV